MLKKLLIGVAFSALMSAPAMAQAITSTPGLSNSGGTINGQVNLNPIYAGAGNLSNGLCFNAPSPITAENGCFGYGTYNTQVGQLQFSASSAGNLFAFEQLNPTGFAALTFRGADASYPGATTNYEHFALGWLPGGGNGGFDFIEASRFDNALNPLIPPPTFNLFQTGGVDATGGTNYSCTPINLSMSMTCAANSTVNGQLITGTGIPTETTISSGGGTTTIVMSQAATSSPGAESVNFSTPVYAQYTVLVAGGGVGTASTTVNMKGWNASNLMTWDRVNNRVGINKSAPSYPLDVNGSANIAGTLNSGNGPVSAAAWGTQGIGTILGGGPFTDTTSSGTVAQNSSNVIQSPVLKASSATTYTNAASFHIPACPTASTNVTITNCNALVVGAATQLSNTTVAGSLNLFGGAVTLNNNSNFTINIGTGTDTQPVNIGGSSNATALGSATITVPNITTDTSIADATVCRATTGGRLYFGSGTIGICLGTSSARYKHDIAALNYGLDAVLALRPISYYLNADHGDPTHQLFGFTAEDMKPVVPELVGLDTEGKPNTADYLGLVPVLVKAVQEQQAEIEELKAKLAIHPQLANNTVH